jgi:hypothetical protein
VRIAIVGHEAAKFTRATEDIARQIIRELIEGRASVVVSGGCHLGGIDIWAVEEARSLGIETREHLPKKQTWNGGYRERNLKIARDCDEAHCIVVERLPSSYTGMDYGPCYHCKDERPPHVKSGGCWTVIRAAARHIRRAEWHIIRHPV